MKILYYSFLVCSGLLFVSCGESGSSKQSQNVDVCRCLQEPGDSPYMTENRDACRDAISREIGVDNWEKVNMSENPDVSARFDELAKKCQ
jgi:hypothetical protein